MRINFEILSIPVYINTFGLILAIFFGYQIIWFDTKFFIISRNRKINFYRCQKHLFSEVTKQVKEKPNKQAVAINK